MRNLYSSSTASFFPAASLWSSLPITDHNRPFLIKCAPFPPIKQTFCPPAVKKSSIKNDPKSIHYVEYHTSCWGAKFRSTHRDREHIQEKSHNKYSEPDYWCWLIFWPAPLRLKERNKVSLKIMELEVKMLNYFWLICLFNLLNKYLFGANIYMNIFRCALQVTSSTHPTPGEDIHLTVISCVGN